jgi:hypothetical protein
MFCVLLQGHWSDPIAISFFLSSLKIFVKQSYGGRGGGRVYLIQKAMIISKKFGETKPIAVLDNV